MLIEVDVTVMPMKFNGNLRLILPKLYAKLAKNEKNMSDKATQIRWRLRDIDTKDYFILQRT